MEFMKSAMALVLLASLSALAWKQYGKVSRFLPSKARSDLIYAKRYSDRVKTMESQILSDPNARLGMFSDTHTIAFLGPPGRRWRLTLMESTGEVLGKGWRDAVTEQQDLYLAELKYEWCLSNIHEICGNVPHHF